MKVPCVVIGGGLSGLAAAIRLTRYISGVVLLEQHSRLGGLNSYYYRNNILIETGLHAITNYAEPGDKRAPLNRLLRQLKIPRTALALHQQRASEIVFGSGQYSLRFSNDFSLLQTEIGRLFPHAVHRFGKLIDFLDSFDPFEPGPFRSTRRFLDSTIEDPLLIQMLLCPLMYYGSSVENDMDLSQFAIMFQAIYREGFFRPGGTIREFLSLLADHFTALGGTIRRGARVSQLVKHHDTVQAIKLASGEIIEPRFILSTIGLQETRTLLGQPLLPESPRLGFIESIFQLPVSCRDLLPQDRTVIFYSEALPFRYQSPTSPVDLTSGVICLPANFAEVEPREMLEVRSTHLASYEHWHGLRHDQRQYQEQKTAFRQESLAILEKYLGPFRENIVYQDTFTPVTIEKYTAKHQGAIYGSPIKIKDGNLGLHNLFLAGTDQGFLGIVGSMLSGVSIVNQHILPKL